MKEQSEKIILCDFKCPKHETCAFYCEGFVKRCTDHWGIEPYNYVKDSCSYYQKRELDIIKLLNYKP